MYDSVFMEEATVSKNWNCTHIDVSDKVRNIDISYIFVWL